MGLACHRWSRVVTRSILVVFWVQWKVQHGPCLSPLVQGSYPLHLGRLLGPVEGPTWALPVTVGPGLLPAPSWSSPGSCGRSNMGLVCHRWSRVVTRSIMVLFWVQWKVQHGPCLSPLVQGSYPLHLGRLLGPVEGPAWALSVTVGPGLLPAPSWSSSGSCGRSSMGLACHRWSRVVTRSILVVFWVLWKVQHGPCLSPLVQGSYPLHLGRLLGPVEGPAWALSVTVGPGLLPAPSWSSSGSCGRSSMGNGRRHSVAMLCRTMHAMMMRLFFAGE